MFFYQFNRWNISASIWQSNSSHKLLNIFSILPGGWFEGRKFSAVPILSLGPALHGFPQCHSSVVSHCVILYIHVECDKYTHIYIYVYMYTYYICILYFTHYSVHSVVAPPDTLNPPSSSSNQPSCASSSSLSEKSTKFWSVMSLVSQSWHKGLSLPKVEKSTQKYCKYLWLYLYSTGIITFWSTFLS